MRYMLVGELPVPLPVEQSGDSHRGAKFLPDGGAKCQSYEPRQYVREHEGDDSLLYRK